MESGEVRGGVGKGGVLFKDTATTEIKTLSLHDAVQSMGGGREYGGEERVWSRGEGMGEKNGRDREE